LRRRRASHSQVRVCRAVARWHNTAAMVAPGAAAAAAAAAVVPVAAAGAGGSSCLSVFGLAYDATEREVHVLFSGCMGYSRCIVVPGKGTQRPYAFVQFVDQKDALVAMESRQGTTWEDGEQAVSIELAKRDIPDKFGPRQPRGQYTVIEHAMGPALLPPGKRHRQEPLGAMTPAATYSLTPQPQTTAPLDPSGPRTLHLGGLPHELTQADLDSFLEANFCSNCLGGSLDLGGGGRGGSMSTPRAFVGFTSHQAAADAQAMLEGFNWEGAQLRAEWARTEYRPPVGERGKGAGGGFGDVPAIPALMAPSPRGPAPIHYRNVWEAQITPHYDDRSGAKCTLHFTNLPFMAESEFSEFLTVSFPEQVSCAHFKDLRDGRPPVAWVLFIDENVAAAALSSHQMFDLRGSQVVAQYARTELDPAKFRR